MTEPRTTPEPNTIEETERNKTSIEAAKADPRFAPGKRALQHFQSRRLNGTYTDLKSRPEYDKIARFFFEKLYAPEDFAFRDASIKTLHRILKGAVYTGMVSAVGMVIELHELSDRLDERMVARMLAEDPQRHGAPEPNAAPERDPERENVPETDAMPDLDMATYQRLYRALDNYDERVYQIRLVGRVNRAFHRLSRMWVVGISLKTVRVTARMIGMGKIMDFVHEGYVAFRTIADIEPLVSAIEARELAWHERLWSGPVTESPTPESFDSDSFNTDGSQTRAPAGKLPEPGKES